MTSSNRTKMPAITLMGLISLETMESKWRIPNSQEQRAPTEEDR